MKRAWVLLATVSLTHRGPAQRPGVVMPASVGTAFARRFPGAHNVSWTSSDQAIYRASFSRNGANVRATFTSSGAWVQSVTEIGAITLPEVIRSAIIRNYQGYQFTETDRIDRAALPVLLFEVHLARPGEQLTVQFEPDGVVHAGGKSARQLAPPPAPAQGVSVAGIWRGNSRCLPGYQPCHDDSVVYRFTRAIDDTAGYDVRMARVVAGAEAESGRLACTLDYRRAALLCISQAGTWEFHVATDSLSGGLTLGNGLPARHVAVRREP